MSEVKATMKIIFIVFIMILWSCSVAIGQEESGTGITADLYTEEQSDMSSGQGNAREPENLPILDEHATLKDYLVYAAISNPELKAAFNRWQAQLEKVPQADAFPDPVFSYMFFIEPIETRVGPQRQKFSLSQTFPWFGQRDLRGRAADEKAAAEWQRLQNLKLKLFFRVKQTYYEYYFLGRSIEITDDNLKLLTYLENVVRANYKTGLARYTDVVKAQVVIGELEDRLQTLREMRNPVAARLNAALNRPADAIIPWPDNIGNPPDSLDEPQLYQWLQEHNPELKAIRHQALSEEHQMDLTEKEGRPDFTVGFDFIDIGEARMPDVPDSGKNALAVRVGLNIPLWRDKYGAARREAEMRHSNFLFEQKGRENNLQAALKLAIFQFQDAKRKERLYGNTLIPKAEQSLGVNQKAFAAGNADFLDLIDAQQTLLEYRLAFERASSDRAISTALIESLVGKELDAMPSDTETVPETGS
jgi:outer membrane protein TolC